MNALRTYCSALGLLVLILTHGCATNVGGYIRVSEVKARLQGMTKEDVAIKLGAPTEAIKVSEAVEVWTYRTGSIGLGGGQCVISVTMKNATVIDAKINKTDRSPLVAPLGSCESIIANLD